MSTDLRAFELKTAIGVAEDPADPKSKSPTRRVWPTDPGGNNLQGSVDAQDVETEHGFKGSIHSYIDKRNSEAQTITGPFYPELASLLNAGGTHPDFRTASGFPQYYHVVRGFGDGNLGTAISGNTFSHIGSDYRGVISNGLSISGDQDAGGYLRLEIPFFLQADRALEGYETASTDALTAGSAVTVNVTDSAGFEEDDFVTLYDDDNEVLSLPALITSIPNGTSIVIDTLDVDVDGSGATALVVRKDSGVAAADLPTEGPYPVSNTYIDLDVGINGWSGATKGAKRFQIALNNDIEVEGFRGNKDDALHQSWGEIIDGTQQVTGSVGLNISEDAHTDYQRGRALTKMALRIMGYSGAADLDETSGAVVAGATSVTLDDATDFLVGQKILLDDGTNQSVTEITAKAGNVLTVEPLDTDIGDEALVANTAFEIKVPKADILTAPLEQQGKRYGVTVNFSGKTDLTTGQVMLTKAYDHVFQAA